MKIVFFGTPAFAASVLNYLHQNNVEISAVVTRPDKPKGRSKKMLPSKVKEELLLLKKEIPIYQPEKASDPAFAGALAAFDADLFVVVAYGEILKQHVLDMPKMGCINVHASLLPRYRGAAPIQRAIINGEKETGVTIMHMVRKMDAGNIIKVAKTAIEQNETYGDLEEKLCTLGSKLLLEVINDFDSGNLAEIVQDENNVTYAPKIESADLQIDWSLDAVDIHNRVRGLSPNPGAFCNVLEKSIEKRLKILLTEPIFNLSGVPGTRIYNESKDLIIACGKGAVKVLNLQLEGKKRMTAKELMLGMNLEF